VLIYVYNNLLYEIFSDQSTKKMEDAIMKSFEVNNIQINVEVNDITGQA
jgi:hypothetical protein